MFPADICELDFQVLQIIQHTKYLEQPDYNNDHNNGIKNEFNGSLHGNVVIHEPENNSGHYEDDDDSKYWHNK
jgi:hypothetical protein